MNVQAKELRRPGKRVNFFSPQKFVFPFFVPSQRIRANDGSHRLVESGPTGDSSQVSVRLFKDAVQEPALGEEQDS